MPPVKKAPKVADAPAPVPAATKKEVPVPVPVAAPVPPPAPVAVPEPAPVADAAPLVGIFDLLEAKMKNLAEVVKETVAELKNVKKEYERVKKIVDKTERKRANARSNLNGFAKPVPVSDELCKFFGLPIGSELARIDITRKIVAYIREHNLNRPDNKRMIVPDVPLRKLFQLADGEEISYFSIQKHITKVVKPKAAVKA